MSKKKKRSDQIIVALDTADLKWAKKLVKLLHKRIRLFKVGKELYTAWGTEAVKAVRWEGGHIFLDLKFHDIPNTVAGAVREATKQNVFMMTVHTMGGSQMLEAARRAVEETVRRKRVKRRPKLMGVTVLTSINEHELKSELWIERPLQKTVLHLAEMADRAGLDGVIASGRELAVIRRHLGKDLLVVTPGIRPAWATKGDQRRIMTPQKALSLGADYLVIGRPITAAKDPLEAAEKVIEEIS
ncbi:MAG: orotidine-5'-phosphate decarboxylase [Candidatus Omnitrophica bacterium CG11_big_fil_rev_8_21_14_0_20_45_26]|uniref:Orotidine 5'-phosphate decarboxylase n=1 Tax=Candidatus Abzuiibacterium crystallinum TaxID=1974748 RepID=A0A2H0LNP7_9BACT|nr:MAG: orotidine-5'-phosphate decarboxylase [Candidatus Omnitrophica bacterium CG11_big_fil_rev_8_21_14_0_20_45_26]PIW65679.1 MAG: orotidine-5'-phosphate decarboxylase [Candidatus Omnitrophica bacterium CG12_big_fil_rev_8_21_14_0_65_45_16]